MGTSEVNREKMLRKLKTLEKKVVSLKQEIKLRNLGIEECRNYFFRCSLPG